MKTKLNFYKNLLREPPHLIRKWVYNGRKYVVRMSSTHICVLGCGFLEMQASFTGYQRNKCLLLFYEQTTLKLSCSRLPHMQTTKINEHYMTSNIIT